MGLFDSLTTPADQATRAAAAQTNALRALLDLRLRTADGDATNPTRSATYAAGLGALRDATAAQTNRDAGAAAARGMTGGTFELAQAAERTRAAGAQQRDLMATSAAEAERRQAALLQMVMAAQAMQNQNAQAGDAARAGRMGAVAGGVGQIVGAVLGSGVKLGSIFGKKGGFQQPNFGGGAGGAWSPPPIRPGTPPVVFGSR